MNSKQPADRLGRPLICILSCCVLAALAGTILYVSAGAGVATQSRTGQPARMTGKLRPVSARAAGVPADASTSHARVTNAYERLPLAFDANQGQTDPQVKYIARGRGYTLFLTANKTVLSMSSKSSSASTLQDAMIRRNMGFRKWEQIKRQRARAAKSQVAVLSMEMPGANPNPQIAAQHLLPGVTNYLIGNDPSKWRTNVPQYARVAYQGVYPGVDLAFHGEQRQLEFDFLVAPGADPTPIGLQFTGAKEVALDDSGNLVLASAAGDVTMKKPVAYQENRGVREPVEVSFVMKDHGQVKLALGNYDRSRELVIDPTLNYATYLGGSAADEALGIAIDGTGNSYITGDTSSPNFPGTPTTIGNAGGVEAFVTKLKPDGSAILYSTLFGGSGDDFGLAIAVDALGDAFVAGNTSSTDLHVSGNAAQSVYGGGATDAFLAELNPAGSALLYLTYLGGAGQDDGFAVALDSAANAYIGGDTVSANYPGATGSLNLGNNTTSFDGFVAKINTASTGSLAFFTYLGGSSDDLVSGLAIDAPLNIVTTGNTDSADYPTTNGAFQTTCGTDGDATVTKLNSSGSLTFTAPDYSACLGGGDDDVGVGVTADSSGNAYVTGSTSSSDFPVVNPFQASNLTPVGDFTAFVTKVNPTGSALVFSSFLGGSNTDFGESIAIDKQSPPNLYLTGTALSLDFPTADAFQTTLNGNSDAFVTEVDGNGASLIYSSYLGGTGDENFESPNALGGFVAVDPTGIAYVSGITSSAAGLAKNAQQANFGGNPTDGFVAQISAASGSAGADFSVNVTPSGATVNAGQSTSPFAVTVTSLNNFAGTVTLSCTGLPSTPANNSTCVFGSSSVQLVGGAQAATTLTITTTARTSAQLAPDGKHSGGAFYALWLPVAGMALFGAGFPARRKKLFLALGGLLLLGLIILPGCSSSSHGGGGGGGGNGTPAGTYTVSVTGTSGSTTHSAGIILVVN